MFDAFDSLVIETINNAIYSLPYANAQLGGMAIGYYTYLAVLLCFAGEIYVLFTSHNSANSSCVLSPMASNKSSLNFSLSNIITLSTSLFACENNKHAIYIIYRHCENIQQYLENFFHNFCENS